MKLNIEASEIKIDDTVNGLVVKDITPKALMLFKKGWIPRSVLSNITVVRKSDLYGGRELNAEVAKWFTTGNRNWEFFHSQID